MLLAGRGGYDLAFRSSADAAMAHARTARLETGGLTEPLIQGGLSSNLLVNPDFSKDLEGWKAETECWSVDRSASADGTPSLKLSNPDKCVPWIPGASNERLVTPGLYTIAGEIKTLALDGTRGGVVGVRAGLAGADETAPLGGTHDWTPFKLDHIVVPPASSSTFRIDSYNKPSGTAWFRRLSMQREIPAPLKLFLLYPNYRGLLFDDMSQIVKMNVEVTTVDSRFNVQLTAKNADGNVVASAVQPVSSAGFTMQLDLTPVPPGSYTIDGTLAGPGISFKQSPYRVVKLPASIRPKFKALVDERNRLRLDDGKPHFVLGIYDTTGFSESIDAWTPELKQIARAPINMVINYWITNASIQAIHAYTDAMKPFGIRFLATVNNFYPDNHDYPAGQVCADKGPDQLISCYSSALASNSRVVGYYVQDEPLPDAAEQTFHQYQLIKANDPGGITVAVLNRPQDLALWRDSVDVLSTDPYPMWVPPYKWSVVPDRTRAAVQAVHGSRPVWTVIQFFQATSRSTWPTERQLFDMSWSSIAEGATGLFYWSYGARALAWVTKIRRSGRICTASSFMCSKELKTWNRKLLADDSQVLAANSQQGTIVTKEKSLPGRPRCVIAYNHSSAPVTAMFTLKDAASSVDVHREGRDISVLHGGTTFTDSFEPYQAHIYRIR